MSKYNYDEDVPHKIFGFKNYQELEDELKRISLIEGGVKSRFVSMVTIVGLLRVQNPAVYILSTMIMEITTGLKLHNGKGDLFEYLDKALSDEELATLAENFMMYDKVSGGKANAGMR